MILACLKICRVFFPEKVISLGGFTFYHPIGKKVTQYAQGDIHFWKKPKFGRHYFDINIKTLITI